MNAKRTYLLVSIEQDPVPGWGHAPIDHLNWLRSQLAGQIPHYNPTVELTTAPTIRFTCLHGGVFRGERCSTCNEVVA